MMKRLEPLRHLSLSVVTLLTLFSFACGKNGHPSLAGQLTTNDVADPNKTTGAENAQGLPYAGYNATKEISDLKDQIEDTEENKTFAQEIQSAQVSVPKTLDPSVQPGTSPQNLAPLDLKVQWKGIATPLDFQGYLTLTDGTYKSNMIEVSGQRPDLNMTAECTDAKCNHGNFFVFDPQNRKAGIVVTNENRVFKYKTPADPLDPSTTNAVPDELKKDQKLNVNTFQVINGVSKFELRNIDDAGHPADVEYSGELVEPNGECPKLQMTDKSSGQVSSLCLRGYTGDGDFLLRGEVKAPQSTAPPPVTPPAAPAAPAPNPTQDPVQIKIPFIHPRPTRDTPPPIVKQPEAPQAPQVPLYFYLQSDRADDTPTLAAQPKAPAPALPSDPNCPSIPKSDNPVIKDIMADCNQPSVLATIKNNWVKNRSLTRFLNSANNCQGSLGNCDSANFKKMATVLVQSNLPLVTGFITVQESGFTAGAVGRDGEIGWWQFMKDTAKKLHPILEPEDLKDISKSTKGFVEYFTLLLQKWDGDFNMALLSYNHGDGGAQMSADAASVRWNKDSQIPDVLKEDFSIYKNFWDIQRYCMTKNIFYVTRNGKTVKVDMRYVPQVLGAIFAGTAPEAYGINGYPGLEMK